MPLPCCLSALSFSFALSLLSFHGRNFPRLSTSGRRPLRPRFGLSPSAFTSSSSPCPFSSSFATLSRNFDFDPASLACLLHATFCYGSPPSPANVSLARWPFFLRGASFNLQMRSSATVARVTTSSSMMMMVMTTIITYVSSLLLLL